MLKETLSTIQPIISAITDAGGTAYLVGGCVRDFVLNRDIKDLDIEVHKLSLEQLETVLKKYGNVMFVGKKFGVLRIAGIDADWALPRKDSIGRKPDVVIDPTMSIEQACRRRDITMNAMAIDIGAINYNNVTIIDPYGGLDDIKNKRLRAVDEKLFSEDPLRFFRVMQFIGRFEMYPDAALTKLCATISLHDIETGSELARERIYEEIKKLLLKSIRPSRGFRWLHAIERLHEIFPELYALIGVKQPADHHPEGDVFEHTMQSLDAAAMLSYYQTDEEKLMIMFGVLCHDLGKATTTDENLHAYGHENAGVAISKKFLKRLTDDSNLIKTVGIFVKYHLLPFRFIKEGAGSKAYKRLAHNIAPYCSLRQLGLVNLADKQGRNGNAQEPLCNSFLDVYEQFIAAADAAAVTHKPEAPILLGRHLLDHVLPGPVLGKLLDEAYKIQIEEGITNLEILRQRVLALQQDYHDPDK